MKKLRKLRAVGASTVVTLPPDLLKAAGLENGSRVVIENMDNGVIRFRAAEPGEADERETCRNGHLWNETNVYVSPKGVESCKLCREKANNRNTDKQLTAELKVFNAYIADKKAEGLSIEEAVGKWYEERTASTVLSQ